MMETVIGDFFEEHLIFIFAVFVACEFVKAVARLMLGKEFKAGVILTGFTVAFLLAVVFDRSFLPPPDPANVPPSFLGIAQWIGPVITALLWAGAATGLYEWAKHLLPFFDQYQNWTKQQAYRI